MPSLSVCLKVDGREVELCSRSQETGRFSPLDIAQLVALASTVVGRVQRPRGDRYNDAFPTCEADIAHVGDKYQRLLYPEL